MDKLALRILLAGIIAREVDVLRGVALPHFVTCDFQTCPEDASEVPDDSDVVVITDDLALAQELLCSHEATKCVLLGQEDDLTQAEGVSPQNLVDVWPPNEPAASRTCRFERLLCNLRNQYDAWLYRTWLMSLIDSLPDLVWYKERSGLHNLVNLEFCKTVHKTREETKDKGHCFIWNVPPESEYQCAETDNAVMSGGKTVIANELVETDQGMRQFRTYKSPVIGRDGKTIVGTVGLAHDVTDFANMGMELQILMGNLPFPAALADNDWRLISANFLFCETFGMSQEDVRNLDYLAWRNTLQEVTEDRVGSHDTTRHTSDLVIDHNGERSTFEVSEPLIVDSFNNVRGHYCLFRDVTMEREFERRTVWFANTDMLTGLSNRRQLYSYLEKHVGRPMGLLYLDLDNFKLVNDTYGHAKGDEVLIRVAQLMREMMPDGLCAREGGDEFACCFDGPLDENMLHEIADRLSETIANEFAPLGVGLGCSIGIAYTDALPANSDEFLHDADTRMYAEKIQHHAKR